MTLFIFLSLVALAPLLYSGVVFLKDNLYCSIEYSFICFVADAILPVIAVTILSLLVGFIKGEG
ncbi:MAG: hypothetical protein NC935_02270 [Candidatus Omnitrophica bacterium]|nr:hypothetical protein [Candidatus Omnitrophota bacterium]